MTDSARRPWSTIGEALERLDRRVLLESLQPGIDSEAVSQRLDAVGLPSSDDIESLYDVGAGLRT